LHPVLQGNLDMTRSARRTGSSHQALVLVGGSLAAMAVLIALLAYTPDRRTGPPRPGSGNGRSDALVVYCAAGIKPPVEAAAREYEAEYGVPVQLQYGGSGTLLSNLRVARSGDLYLAADTSYIDLAREQDLVDEAIPLARVRAVVAFRKGNPKGIESFDDLFRDDVSVALANPDAASIGKLVRDVLTESGQWDDLERKARVFKPTVNEVANDVKLGAVDAGIVWDATVRQYPDLEMVAAPVFDEVAHEVTIAVLRSCRHPSAALHFARFLAARDKGLEKFAEAGYEPAEGDVWAEQPEITFFCGGINRVAVEQTIKEFEQREGVRVNVVYNGCGILVGMMKTGQNPDAYFACTEPFMNAVADRFERPTALSDTEVVVLVKAGNPHNIRSLADLARPGLKVGMTNPQQSALGTLTEEILQDQGLLESIQDNIQTQQPTADQLILQMRTGSLDAAIVFEANSAYDEVEVVRIDHPLARARQPIAVGRNSNHKQLMGRLLNALSSAESEQRFRSVGFGWLPKLELEVE
jgi:molybdate transport system substrate-binding protein